VPRRSLTLLVGATVLAIAVTGALHLRLDQFMLAASACFVATTLAGLLAAVKLLPRRTASWWGAVVASVAIAVVLAFSGVFLAWPLALFLGALAYTRRPRVRLVALPEPAAELRPAA
jgi:amino acid efflux transporter